MEENGRILKDKLDEFIRKYYRNQLVRGSVLTIALLAGIFLLLDLSEFAFRFGPVFRLIIFYSYLLLALLLVTWFIVVPLLKMQRVGKTISYEYAARIIGDHFPEISDKLLNTLQLMEQEEIKEVNLPLLVAGIDQRIRMMRPFPFGSVISLKKNLKYLKYALPPLIIILAGIFVAPSVISVPAERIIRYNTAFVKELPYSFKILNDKLSVLQQGDFQLIIAFSGEEIPEEVLIRTDGASYRMQKGKGFTYTYLFRSMQKDLEFVVLAGELTSEPYTIKVIPRPIILNFETLLEYPAYIKRPREKLENTGDLNVPEGTRVTWNLETKDADNVLLGFADGRVLLKKQGNERLMSFSRKLDASGQYSMVPRNAYAPPSDSMVFGITVVGDAYPSIYVQESTDSSMAYSTFFRGTIKDDYGFSKLLFHYEIKNAGDTAATTKNALQVPIDNALNSQLFYYMWDAGQLLTGQGEEIRYYFEVWDNDGIHGPKATRSDVRIIKTLTLEEIAAKTADNGQNIIDDLENSLKESESARKTLDDLNRKMVEKNTLNFQERKQLEDLIKANEKILKTVEDIKKRNDENIRNSSDYLKTSQDILEKQKRLNELMDQLMTDDMKKLMKEIRDMMDKVDKAKLAETLDKMKKSQQDIEQQLDRNLQLFKQLEFDRKLEETIRSLKETAEQQQKLAEKSEMENANGNKDLEKEQKAVKDAFDSIKSDLESLKEKEKELEKPLGLDKTEGLQDSISKNLDESGDMLRQGESKKASGKQKKSAGQMNQLANQLEQMSADAEMEQTGEDAAQIRMILESLLRMSFEQENLIGMTAETNRNDPKFQELIYRQKEVKDKLNSAEDSLIAISRRQPLLAPVITREIKDINTNLEQIVTALTGRNLPVAQVKQQLTMASINDLALLLDEALQQMNQNIQSMMKGSGQKLCNNPSNSGGSRQVKGIKEMQQKMSDQLKKMKEGLEKEGKDKTGQTKQGQGSMNEQIARLAAEQEQIRNEMQRYRESLEEQGIKDGGNAANTVQEMEQNQRDLINKQITQETIMRQQKIMTRLLQSEKAEMEREMQEKRESREQKEQKYRNFTGDFKYNNLKTGGKEIIEYKSAPYNLFYRNRVNYYMIKIGQ
jgi:hypothetical protein